MSLHQFARRGLSLFVATSLTLPSPLYATAASQPRKIAAAGSSLTLPDHIQQLDRDLTEAARRALYPASAHNNGLGKPSANEVEQLAARLNQWRGDLQQYARRHLLSSPVGDVGTNLSPTIIEIGLYFSCVERLEKIRVLLGETPEPGLWPSRYSLNFSADRIGDYSIFEALAKANAAFLAPNLLFYVEMTANGSLAVHLKKSLVRELEELRWASRPDQINVVQLAQYFAGDLLLSNLVLLGELENKSASDISSAPKILNDKFPALREKIQVATQEQTWAEAFGLRQKLAAATPDILAELHNHDHFFLSQDFMQQIMMVIRHGETPEPEQVEQSLTIFRTFEMSDTVSLLPFSTHLWQVSAFNSLNLAQQLPLVVAQTKAMVIRQHLLTEDAIQRFELSETEIEQVIALIETRRAKYAQEIASLSIPLARQVLDQHDPEALGTQQKKKFVGDSVRVSQKLKNIDTSLDLPVVPSALGETLSEELQALKMSPAERQTLGKILAGDDFASARTAYLTHLGLQLQFFNQENEKQTEILDAQSRPEYQSLKKAAATAKWNDREFLALLEQRDQAKKLLSDLPQQRHADLMSWIEVGRIMFFYQFPDKVPQLRDLKLSDSQLRNYRNELKDQLLKSSPILDMELAGTKPVKKIWQVINDSPQSAEAILMAQLPLVRQQIETDLQLIASGQAPGYLDRAKQFVGLGQPPSAESIPSELLLVMSKSLALAQQIGAHSYLVEKYKSAIDSLDAKGQGAQAWDHLVEINNKMMLGIFAWYLASTLIKFPAPKVGAFLNTFERQILRPVFGRRLVWLNNAILALWGASMVDKGYQAFAAAPDRAKLLKNFVNCSVSEPCLIDRGSYLRYDDMVTGMQIGFATEALILPAFLVGFMGLSYLGGKLIPAWRQTLVGKRLESQMIDVGFQNKQYSFFEQDIREMAEASIKSLDRRTHPALNPLRATQPDQPTSLQTSQFARLYLSSRIRAAAESAIDRVQSEKIYWKRWEQRLKPSIDALNLGEFWNNPIAFHKATLRIAALQPGKDIRPEYITYLKDCQQELAEFLIPHFARAQSDSVYGALMSRIWGEPLMNRINLDELRNLTSMGGSFQTVAVYRSKVGKGREVVPYGQNGRPGVSYPSEIEVQLARRSSVYQIRNSKWLAELRKYVDASDFWTGEVSSTPLIKGSAPQKLIGKREVPLLPYFRKKGLWDE